MLGRRKPQRDLFRPDNLLSDYVGEHSLYGLLAQHGAEWFSDDSFSSLRAVPEGVGAAVGVAVAVVRGITAADP